MLRVSASDVDAFRYFQAAEFDDDEAAQAALVNLVAQLRRELPPSPQMAVGSAGHKALEFAKPGEFDRLEADGYTFLFSTDMEIELPDIREIKAEAVWDVHGFPVELVGKVDCIEGLRVDDHKFTFRYDAERFLASYQWRIYLAVFGAEHFRWNVFELFQGRDHGPKEFDVRALHIINQYRYPGMEADITAALSEFVEFARVHLPERFQKAAA